LGAGSEERDHRILVHRIPEALKCVACLDAKALCLEFLTATTHDVGVRLEDLGFLEAVFVLSCDGIRLSQQRIGYDRKSQSVAGFCLDAQRVGLEQKVRQTSEDGRRARRVGPCDGKVASPQ
jgi:hypothetical protein